MPKIIVTCRILKPAAKGKSSRGGYVKYMATREGVEKPPERDKYVRYMAERPGVVKESSHGLFSGHEDNIVLDRAVKEIEAHEGNVWSHIVCLKREDAERMGFVTLPMWRELLNRQAPTIAAAMKIKCNNFRWYAAFHNKKNNPHIHIVAFSTDPTEGFLTKQGIEKIRSAFANDIYRDELQNLYQEQTVVRNMLREEADEKMKMLAESVADGGCGDTELMNLLAKLSEQLKSYKGKKVYGYLPKKIKDTVNSVVARLAFNPDIAKLYENRCRLEQEKLETYSGAVKTFPPLEGNNVFKSIRNAVIASADEIKLDASTGILSEELDEPEIIIPDFSGSNMSHRIRQPSLRQSESDTDETKTAAPAITLATNTLAPPPSAQKQIHQCAVQLLCVLSKMLSDDFCHRRQNERAAVDQKLRRQTREKKQALGARDEQSEDETQSFDMQMM